MKNERNKQANGAVCVCVCEELNFTYSSLKSSLPALSLLFNASTWRMSDLYARTKLQINLLKMIVKAVRCAGVYFQHTPPTCSRSASNSLSLSLTLSVSFLFCLSLALSVPVALGCMFPSCNMQEFLRKNIDDLANVH